MSRVAWEGGGGGLAQLSCRCKQAQGLVWHSDIYELPTNPVVMRCGVWSGMQGTARHGVRSGCVTNAGVSLRCCIEDGSRPPEVRLQELASNRPVRLRSKGRGRERLVKRHREDVR
jgi:hypothetical protein